MRDSPELRIVVLVASLLVPCSLYSQGSPINVAAAAGNAFLERNLEVKITTPEGKALDQPALVQLLTVTGQLYSQATAKNGQARFTSISKSEYRIVVTAPGFQPGESRVDLSANNRLVSVDLQLIPIADAEDAASQRNMQTLSPKAQKELSKAVEALRAKKPADARSHLEMAHKVAPESADVEYVLGIYSSRVNDPAQAVAHWSQALSFNPNHLSALLELSQELLHESKPAEATAYLQHALKIEPSSWRAHAFSAEAAYLSGDHDEAVKHAERALELGRDRAAGMQPFLAGVLFERGDTERAMQTMQAYVDANPGDAEAAKQLEGWKHPSPVRVAKTVAAPAELPIPSSWMPPDVDEKIPPVEAGAVCSLDDLLQKTGERLTALVQDLDRFTATEWVSDQNINRYGLPASTEKEKFSYTVSIHEMRPGMLTVDEYRSNEFGHTAFPDGVITTGLPALVLVFHPFYAGNYEMTCEGLARGSNGLAWQVHFRQRPNKPIELRGFRVGRMGSAHPAGLRGRAWIAADTNQVVRLETDLVAAMPEIRLTAEHIAVEYHAVRFQKENVDLWLPNSAEVYFDWRGQRVHRRHAFDNYLLFSIDSNERISEPKEQKPSNGSEQNAQSPPS